MWRTNKSLGEIILDAQKQPQAYEWQYTCPNSIEISQDNY